MTPPRLELTDVVKAFGGVQALRGVDFALQPGIDPRPRRRERRRQEHADEDHRRRSRRRCRRDARSTASPSTSARRATRAPRGIGMVHQELSVAPDLSVAENVFLGSQPVERARPRRLEAHGARGGRATEEPRPRHRPARAARRFPDRRAAARRTRARAVLRRAHRHPRRADLGAFAARDRAAVRGAAPGARQRPQPRLHLAFPRRHPRRSPTRCRCSATARSVATAEVGAGDRQGLDHRAHDRRRAARSSRRAISATSR